MKLTLLRAAALTVAFGSVALAQTPPEGKPAVEPGRPAIKLTPEAMKMADERFLKAGYSANMLHAKASEYALTQVQRPEVRELAEMLMKDHVAANMALRGVAEKAGVQVPNELLPPHQAMLDMAMMVKGDEFASVYLFNMASLHVHGILEVSHKMGHTENAAIKEYCSQALPKLKTHFGKIKPLAEAEAGVTDGMMMTK